MALYPSNYKYSMLFKERGVHLFCFGFGYVAQALAARLQAEGWLVSGTTRDAQKAANMPNGYQFDNKHPLNAEGLKALRDATHILISIPPEEGGVDSAYRHHASDIPAKAWLGYLSTTGVYGDYNGDWVDEKSAMLATEPRSIRRIDAERNWRGQGAHVFRLAGIYGPGRCALEQVQEGNAQRIYKPGQVFSRAHVDDIAQVLHAAIQQPKPQEVYNVCDDEPAPSHEVIAYACELLGQELPPLTAFDEAELSPMAQSFYSSNRRVSNRKIKDKLGVNLLYPTYREGLASILHSKEHVS